MENKEKLRMPKILWHKMIAELKRRGRNRRESGAFLLSKHGSNEVTEFICFDDLDKNCLTGMIEFHSDGFIKLWKYCKDNGLKVLADVHTHPSKWTNQSDTDIENPMIPSAGHIAIIIPYFATVRNQNLQGVGVFEYLGSFKWEKLKSENVSLIKEYNSDNTSRLAGLEIENDPTLADKGIGGYEIAVKKLRSLKLLLKCGANIKTSIALQAALVTSVNTGKRAFQGGVKVILDKNIPLLISWPNAITLNEVIESLGGEIVPNDKDNYSFILTFDLPAYKTNSLQVVCNGWQGGVVQYSDNVSLNSSPDFALGGVLAGALGVGQGFLKVSGEKLDACFHTTGISLWRPDLNWLSKEAEGPTLEHLPQKYWFVGLGHLGQAFIWTLGLLPFANPAAVTIMLQDYDTVSESNLDTGMLSEEYLIGEKKTRVCNNWLEDHDFQTRLIEKCFDKSYKPDDTEARVLIRGLDSLKARQNITIENFDLIIDCGIGGTKTDFDSISIINLKPNGRKPDEIWPGEEVKINNRAVEKAMNSIGCGFYGKGISTSFVGAFSSTLVLSELIRAGYQGIKTSSMSISMRNIDNDASFIVDGNYTTEIIRNGFA